MVDLFDTSGTLIGTAQAGNLLDKNGKLPRMRKTLLADSSATIVGATLGTSTTTTYVESSAGIAVGGRSGLTAVVIGALFLLALFFSPLATTIPKHATAPALIFISCFMAKNLIYINWDDITDYIPSVLTAVAMPFTYSITDGLALGIISYIGIKLLAGKHKDINIAMYVVSLLFVAKYTIL